jgi:O-antigen/teichoic acid export membrane protein
MYIPHITQYVQKGRIFVRTIYNATVVKDFFIYSCGALLLRMCSFLIAPCLLRTIPPEEYGILALVNSFIAVAAPLVGLGLRQVLTLEYFHHFGIKRQQLVNEIIIIYASLCIPVFILIYGMRIYLQQWLCLTHHNDQLIVCALIQIVSYFFVELLYQVLGYERKAYLLARLQISIACITLISSFFFVLYANKGIVGILLAQCLGSCIAICFGIYYYYVHKYHLTVFFNSSIRKTMYYIRYGLPAIPGMLCAWLLASGNRWFLLRYSTMHDVGIYAIADMFTQLFHVVVLLPWTSSYLPYILTKYSENKNNLLVIEQQNQTIMYSIMISMFLVIIGASVVCSPVLILLLPASYHPAITYIWPLMIGQIFLLGSYFASSFIQFHKKNYFLAFAFCIPAILNSILNSALILYFGLYGCIASTCIAYMVYFGIILSYNNKLQKQHYHEKLL